MIVSRRLEPAGKKGRALLGVLLLSSSFWIGCSASTPPSGDQWRSAIEQDFPDAELRKEHHLHLGRFVLGVSRGVLSLGADDELEREALSILRSVEVSTYEVTSLPSLMDFDTPKALDRRLSSRGWIPLLKQRDEDSRTWVYIRENADGAISNLHIVDLDSFEMTVVDLKGRFDRVVAALVAEDPMGFVDDL